MSERSRQWRDVIKNDRPPGIVKAARRLKVDFALTPLAEILGPDVTLVPTPRSTPHVPGVLWPARRIAEELVAHGLGLEVLACVSRLNRTQKSSVAPSGERPTAQEHFDSLGVEPILASPRRIAVVDDFVTKGATMLATASHVQLLFPEATVHGFALVRTRGLVPEIDQIIDACVGTIRLTPDGDVDRQP